MRLVSDNCDFKTFEVVAYKAKEESCFTHQIIENAKRKAKLLDYLIRNEYDYTIIEVELPICKKREKNEQDSSRFDIVL